MTEKLNLGKEGEDLAEKFLIERKYKVLERNYRYQRAEIDIIALDDKKNLRIVEVKTLRSQSNPEEKVDEKKLKLIFGAGSHYKEVNEYECEMFIDIVSVNIIDETTIINYFEDVYYEVGDF